MSKQVILAIVSQKEDMQIAPLAMLFVGGALKKAGYEVKVLHISSDEIEKYAKEIISYDALFVGVSSMTGNQTKDSADFSKLLKINGLSAPIVWGGVHASLLPGQSIKEDYIDVVCIGEGEETLVEFAQAMDSKKDIKDIKGIVYKKDGKPVFNAPRPIIQNIDELEADFELIDVESHLEAQYGCKRILTFITSRGCPYNCAFCYNLKFNQRSWRARSAEKVIAQINSLKDRYKLDGIRFYDDFLFANQARAIKILEAINLPWYGELRVNCITPTLVKKLEETQCKEILLGLESGSDRLLKYMNKQQTVDIIKKGVMHLSAAQDIRVCGAFIFALPTETREETFQTVDLILELSKIHPNMRFSAGFYLPYPGSDLYDVALAQGFVPPEKTEDWSTLDRWSDKLALSWSWNKDARYFKKIRDYINVLPLEMLGIPKISKLPRRRLESKDLGHDFEIKMLNQVQWNFAKKYTLTHKIGTKVLGLYKALA